MLYFSGPALKSPNPSQLRYFLSLISITLLSISLQYIQMPASGNFTLYILKIPYVKTELSKVDGARSKT